MDKIICIEPIWSLLSLAIAKEIAILHGGFIEVSSTLHEKTNFSVYLPIIKIGNDH